MSKAGLIQDQNDQLNANGGLMFSLLKMKNTSAIPACNVFKIPKENSSTQRLTECQWPA